MNFIAFINLLLKDLKIFESKNGFDFANADDVVVVDVHIRKG